MHRTSGFDPFGHPVVDLMCVAHGGYRGETSFSGVLKSQDFCNLSAVLCCFRLFSGKEYEVLAMMISLWCSPWGPRFYTNLTLSGHAGTCSSAAAVESQVKYR